MSKHLNRLYKTVSFFLILYPLFAFAAKLRSPEPLPSSPVSSIKSSLSIFSTEANSLSSQQSNSQKKYVLHLTIKGHQLAYNHYYTTYKAPRFIVADKKGLRDSLQTATGNRNTVNYSPSKKQDG